MSFERNASRVVLSNRDGTNREQSLFIRKLSRPVITEPETRRDSIYGERAGSQNCIYCLSLPLAGALGSEKGNHRWMKCAALYEPLTGFVATSFGTDTSETKVEKLSSDEWNAKVQLFAILWKFVDVLSSLLNVWN